MKPRVIKAKQVEHKKRSANSMLAEFCWYYQHYSLAIARKMPAKDVMMLLNMAKKKEAEKYLNLTQIVAAPHSDKGKNVKRLVSEYERIING